MNSILTGALYKWMQGVLQMALQVGVVLQRMEQALSSSRLADWKAIATDPLLAEALGIRWALHLALDHEVAILSDARL